MRSLRERLKAVTSSAPAAPRAPVPAQKPLFVRVTRVPLETLHGVELATFSEVRACDPRFTGTSWQLARVLFLDTETTGLNGGAGTVAFEIGAARVEGDELVLRQYVLRDYAQEGAMLDEVARLIGEADTLVTFNGKSFDLPLLESRMVLCRIRLPLTRMPHLDLLHAARRVYKLRLGRCTLGALESAVLGQTRADDLPGAQVPQRFFNYMKTGEFALLEDVLRHNAQDVISLASLTGVLCAAFRSPQTLTHAQDIYGVGRTLLAGGHAQEGRACMKILGYGTLSSQAHMHLAVSYRRERDWTQTVQTYQTMIARGEGGAWPYVELAKYYEHVAHDVPRALRCATQALQMTLNTAPLHGGDAEEIAPILRRIERLRRKAQGRRGDDCRVKKGEDKHEFDGQSDGQ